MKPSSYEIIQKRSYDIKPPPTNIDDMNFDDEEGQRYQPNQVS